MTSLKYAIIASVCACCVIFCGTAPAFPATSMQIVSPPSMTTGKPLPLVIRAVKGNGDIDRSVDGTETLAVASQGTTTHTVEFRRGVSYTSFPAPSSDCIVSVDGYTGSRNIGITPRVSKLHSGILSETDPVWDDSYEHHITGDCTIPSGSTLRIEAGSVVLLSENCNIFVQGTLEIEGDPANPVLFSSLESHQPWGGIEINGTADINWCFLENGGADSSRTFGHSSSQPVIMTYEADISLDNVFIANNPGKALGGENSHITVDHSVITHCDTGGEFTACVVRIDESWIFDIPDTSDTVADDDNDGLYFNGYHGNGEESRITSCVFINGKDDGIDHNGARLRVEDCWIEGFYHEGIAASNTGYVQVVNTVATGCGQGIEAGYGSPEVYVDHCVLTGNGVGLRFGDSYDWGCSGSLTAMNTILHNNTDNILNHDLKTDGPVEDAIVISYSMTNDPEYDDSYACITGEPLFDNRYYLRDGSPCIGSGLNGVDMGLQHAGDSMQVVINELLAVNENWNPDEYGEFDDWVELYNPGDSPVDIAGMYITDDRDNPMKVKIPDTHPEMTTIPARSHLLLWLDGDPGQGVVHFDFRLSGDGEFIGLYAPDGSTPVDSLSFGSLPADVSYGRSLDNGGEWRKDDSPTPSEDNSMQSSPLREFWITCDPDSFDIIYDNYDEDIYIGAEMYHRGTRRHDVKLRIRGESSRRYPKKSLRVVFEDQPFAHERDTLIINAEYGDKSYMHQYLSSTLFRDIGYPAFDIEYVRIYLNGTFFGLYTLLEAVDESFLKKRSFSSDGSLYKASERGACLSIFDDPAYHWGKKTNEDSGNDDLAAFIERINSVPDDDYESFAREYLDYDQMVDIIAMNILIGNYSTYYHNYYMFHDINGSGKWYMFPWDLDKTMGTYGTGWTYQGSGWHGYRTPDNPFVERALADPVIFSDIRERMQVFRDTVFTMTHLGPVIDSLKVVLEPSIREDGTDDIDDLSEWETALANNEYYIEHRFAAVAYQIDNWPRSFKLHRQTRLLTEPPVLSWEESIDPNGDPVSYTLKYGTSQQFEETATTTVSGLTATSYAVPGNLPDGTYYWHVTATDGTHEVDGFDQWNRFEIAAGTTLPDSIAGEYVMKHSGSPYVVRQDVIVGENGLLTAEPGVIIAVSDTAGIIVDGALSLAGSTAEPIRITSITNDMHWKGIYVRGGSESCSLALTDVIIEYAGRGNGSPTTDAAIYSRSAPVVLDNVTFEQCTAGIYATASDLTITNCLFRHNGGNQITADNGTVTISGTTIQENSDGNGIVFGENTSAGVNNCTLRDVDLSAILVGGNNSILSIDGTSMYACGSGVTVNGVSDVDIVHGIIADCEIALEFTSPGQYRVNKCTLYGNDVGILSSLSAGSADPSIGIRNTIVNAAGTPYTVNDMHAIRFAYSLTNHEQLPGTGNIVGDPQFINPAQHDFHISSNSPCVNSGDPESEPDPDGSRSDIGAYPYLVPELVVTEINYTSSDEIDSEDWVEIFNPNEYALELTGWLFRDSDVDHTFHFPGGTVLAPESYLVISRNIVAFGAVYTGVDNIIGNFDFGLDGDGETIQLIDNEGTIVDEVSYGSVEPWPNDPDKNGYPIALKHWSLDNNNPENWFVSSPGGTPGTANAPESEIPLLPKDVILAPNFPNPFNAGTTITFILPEASRAQVEIYSMTGQRVATLANSYFSSGKHMLSFEAGNLSSGTYMVVVKALGHMKTRRMLLLK